MIVIPYVSDILIIQYISVQFASATVKNNNNLKLVKRYMINVEAGQNR